MLFTLKAVLLMLRYILQSLKGAANETSTLHYTICTFTFNTVY